MEIINTLKRFDELDNNSNDFVDDLLDFFGEISSGDDLYRLLIGKDPITDEDVDRVLAGMDFATKSFLKIKLINKIWNFFNSKPKNGDVSLPNNSLNNFNKIDINKIHQTAANIRSSGGETVAGHALQKNAGRKPDIWGKVKGNSENINNQAMQHIDDIVSAPGDFKIITNDRGIKFLEKILPDGRCIRLNLDGSFKGFIDKIGR